MTQTYGIIPFATAAYEIRKGLDLWKGEISKTVGKIVEKRRNRGVSARRWLLQLIVAFGFRWCTGWLI